VSLVKTDVSEELVGKIFSSTLKMEVTRSPKTSIFLQDPHGPTSQKTAFFTVN
jgi:hypothetical protein